jgi:hypothetical protein
MRRIGFASLLCASGLIPGGSLARDVNAGAPLERSVTIYRAGQSTGYSPLPASLDLNDLAGFALVSETRTVNLPAGESRIRFGGVAEGIEPASALISGLPDGVVEKDQDARVLSPAQLIAAALGHDIVLVRTNSKTGESTRTPAVIRSDAGDGVVFQSAEGIEALRCSGLPETFRFDARTDLHASPTLSVLVQNPKATSAIVTLSYLSRGFDWTASYVAELSGDSHTMDLGAWVTLANGNDVSFPSAHTQVVAGQLNHETESRDPAGTEGQRILARCWPMGTTTSALRTVGVPVSAASAAAPRALDLDRVEMQEIIVTAEKRSARQAALVEEEQLADLKLYRVPEPTSIQSRQMKQVRLLDRNQIPVELYYAADLIADIDEPWFAAQKKLRTRNDVQHHLGLPLPSGRIDTFANNHGTALLISESPMRDKTIDEDVEIELGDSDDVQVKATRQITALSGQQMSPPAELRGVRRSQSATIDQVHTVEIANARNTEIAFELKVQLRVGAQLIAADPAPESTAGRPLFKLTVPANGSATIRYQTEHTERKLD